MRLESKSVSQENDEVLLTRYVATGSEEAFRILVERHHAMVYSYCLRRLNRQTAEADDAAQAVFIVLARRAGSINPRIVLSCWLFQTAKYVVAHIHRDRARRKKHEGVMAKQKAKQNTTGSSWLEARQHVDELIHHLPGKQREAIIMHFCSRMTQREIATRLGCGESTIQMRLKSGLEKLRLRLAGRGVSISTTVLSGFLGSRMVEAAPSGLVTSTCALVMQDITGQAAAHHVVIISKGAMKIMLLTKIKYALLVTLTLVLVPVALEMVGQSLKVPLNTDPKAMAGEKSAPHRDSSYAEPAPRAGNPAAPAGSTKKEKTSVQAGDTNPDEAFQEADKLMLGDDRKYLAMPCAKLRNASSDPRYFPMRIAQAEAEAANLTPEKVKKELEATLAWQKEYLKKLAKGFVPEQMKGRPGWNKMETEVITNSIREKEKILKNLQEYIDKKKQECLRRADYYRNRLKTGDKIQPGRASFELKRSFTDEKKTVTLLRRTGERLFDGEYQEAVICREYLKDGKKLFRTGALVTIESLTSSLVLHIDGKNVFNLGMENGAPSHQMLLDRSGNKINCQAYLDPDSIIQIDQATVCIEKKASCNIEIVATRDVWTKPSDVLMTLPVTNPVNAIRIFHRSIPQVSPEGVIEQELPDGRRQITFIPTSLAELKKKLAQAATEEEKKAIAEKIAEIEKAQEKKTFKHEASLAFCEDDLASHARILCQAHRPNVKWPYAGIETHRPFDVIVYKKIDGKKAYKIFKDGSVKVADGEFDREVIMREFTTGEQKVAVVTADGREVFWSNDSSSEGKSSIEYAFKLAEQGDANRVRVPVLDFNVNVSDDGSCPNETAWIFVEINGISAHFAVKVVDK